MKPQLLLTHFDQISSAPDAIPRLRRFILDLAVRGKLVEQDPNDEPASELVKRIEVEKARLLRSGELKKLEVFGAIDAGEIPFTAPTGWEVVRMGCLARKLGAGSTPLGGKSVYQREGVPFLRSQNVHNDGLRLEDVALISRAVHNQMSGTHIHPQDVLLNITGASIGRCALVPSDFLEGNVSQHVAIIRLFSPTIRDFIHLSLTSPLFQKVIDDVQVGVSREGLSMQRLRLFPMLLPPLAEQHRVVAKVDELMALCDRLEAAKAEQERRRDRLVAASLHRLNNGADAGDLGNHVQFHLRHLPRFTVRPEQISQLRQTIINLAVRGKLVPQYPNEEPAKEHISRAKAEVARLAKDGKIRKANSLPPIEPSTAPFELPAGWAWARFPELGEFNRGKSRHRPRNDPALYEAGKYKLVQTGDVARANGVIRTHTGLYNDVGLAQSRLWPKGTMCITIAANIADSAILSFEACIPDSVVAFIPVGDIELVRYYEYFMRTAKAQLEKFAPSTAQKNINIGILEAVLIPVPPVAEQRRIVTKVDELMAICDRLEAQLTTTQTESRRLLEAVLHEALSTAAPDGV